MLMDPRERELFEEKLREQKHSSKSRGRIMHAIED